MNSKNKVSVFLAYGPLAVLMAFMVYSAYLVYGVSTVRQKVESVLEITYPSNPHSGGTGFVVQAPSGHNYTLTNRHICRGNESGYVRARLPFNDRYITLRVIEMSNKADLCLLTPFPNIEGLKLGQMPYWGQEVTLMGHPLLLPLTRTKGELYEENLIDMALGRDMPEGACAKEGGTEEEQVDSLTGAVKVCIKSYFANRISVIAYLGNSGSPIVDNYGKVVSILFAGDNRTNWGFGVPLFDIKNFLSIY